MLPPFMRKYKESNMKNMNCSYSSRNKGNFNTFSKLLSVPFDLIQMTFHIFLKFNFDDRQNVALVLNLNI